jgi:hypothetical protein
MNEETTESLRRMVYASMSSEAITDLVAPRFGIDAELMRSQIKVMHNDYLIWGISCPLDKECKDRQCEKDMVSNTPIRCSFPM